MAISEVAVREVEEYVEGLDLTGCICPKCGGGAKSGRMVGRPLGPIDGDKFIVVGCCVDDDSPAFGCVKCGWGSDNASANLKFLDQSTTSVESQKRFHRAV